MGDKSTIEWTDATWNPVVGCSHVSDGCRNCYAEELHRTRLDGAGVYPPFKPWTHGNAEHNVVLVPERLDQPLRWRKPRMVFVNSMSDLFHEQIPDEYIAGVFAVMIAAEQHTFQVLTKRPERMAELVPRIYDAPLPVPRTDRILDGFAMNLRADPPRNIWLGTSIESRRHVDRADHLRRTPAAVRFISAEPLLGPLVHDGYHDDDVRGGVSYWTDHARTPELDLSDVDWLIAGGESGPHHRPMEGGWVRDLRDACRHGGRLADEYGRNGTAFFFKQWGGRTPKAGGRELDGRTWDEYPEPAGTRQPHTEATC